MDNQRACSTCGKALEANAPGGLCPECLLKVGLGSGVDVGPDTEPGAARRGFVPPPVEKLAPLFPQLEILGLIGHGGMGAVYKARQKELDRTVALKILPPDIGQDAAFAERFTREAKALAKLDHPGIVTIHDFGRANGLYFFVMEYVDGVNLQQLLHGGRVSAREALAIVPQICDALQFAHDQGIVHRDIKPGNILLDRRGRVKVADFGLAKIVGGEGEVAGGEKTTASANLTEAGKVMGTPQYMSPEQIQAPGEVDHRADIYALGVVFYQMLTGELPGKPIEPPSRKVQIDVRLDEVVLRALEQKPELRYQQASVLKTQIETIASTPAGGADAAVMPPNAKPSGPRQLKIALVGVRDGRRVIHWPGVAFFVVVASVVSMLLISAFNGPGVGKFLPACLVFILVVLGIRCLMDWARPIERLPTLDEPPIDAPSATRGRLRAALIVGVLVWFFVTGTVTVITWIRAESWKMVAVISCPRKSQHGRPMDMDYFKHAATMIDLIRSDVILGRVIDRLELDERSGKLDERWGKRNLGLKLTKAQAMVLLRRRLDVRSSEGGTLIQAGVYGKRPEKWEEAMDIADAIAKELHAFRIEQHDPPADMLEMTARATPPDILLGLAVGFVPGLLAGGLVLRWGFLRRGSQASRVKKGVETIVGGAGEPPGATPDGTRGTPALPETPPRFPRTAIVGACWIPLFFAAVAFLMFEPRHIPFPYGYDPVGALLIFLGLAGFFGTTILGWIAVSQILRSGGLRRGLRLAVFDGLLFPLLALDVLIFLVCSIPVRVLLGLPYSASMEVVQTYMIVGLGLLSVALMVWVDFLIGRAVWRAANKNAAPQVPSVGKTGAADYQQLEKSAKTDERSRPFGKLALASCVGALVLGVVFNLLPSPAERPAIAMAWIYYLPLLCVIAAIVLGIIGWKSRVGKAVVIVTVLLLLVDLLTPFFRPLLVRNRYSFVGKDKDGAYHFETENHTRRKRTYTNADGHITFLGVSRDGGTTIRMGNRELSAAEIEQKRRDLDQIEVLRKQGVRELVSVNDTVVNGTLQPRVCLFKYTLADGSTETIGESSPDQIQPAIPTEQDLKEIDVLRQQGLREVTCVMEEEFNGQFHRTLSCHYVLRDGREMDMGEGDPGVKSSGTYLTSDQLNEMFRLKELGHGRALEPVQRELFGKVFNFQRFVVTLADGTVVTYSEGEPTGLKTHLTKADWDELGKLQRGQAGETLGQYSEPFLGQPCQFTRVRYVLSDGTKVIQSIGKPADSESLHSTP